MNKEFTQEMMRVNLAGEYGAIRIYQGQIDALSRRGETKHLEKIKHMLAQEEEHLHFFQTNLIKNKVRPTIFHPLWHLLGYTLGYASARMGLKSAMACTVAVEEVIDKHYAHQLEKIDKNSNTELYEAIETFRQEELEHRDIALDCHAEEAIGYNFLYKAVQIASKSAIWLSKKL